MAFSVFFILLQEGFLEFVPELCSLPYSFLSLPLVQPFLFLWALSWKGASVGQLWEFLGPTPLQQNSTVTWFLDWNLEISLLVLALLRLTPEFSRLINRWAISGLSVSWGHWKLPSFSCLSPCTVAASSPVFLLLVFCPKSVSLSCLMKTPCHLALL